MRADLVRVRNGQSPMAPLVMSDDERTAMLATSSAPTRRINGRHATAAADDYDDYYDDEPPRRSTGKLIGIVAAVLVALSLVGFFAYQVLSGPPAPQTVEVPPVAGLSENDARAQVLAAGLRLGDPQRRESSVEQRGQVIDTNPPIGTQVDERTVVTLIVGSGPASVNVPLLAGKTVQEAQALLEQAGLELGTQTQQETSDSRLVNRVIGSTPPAGSPVEGGSEVALIIGIEQTGVQIPENLIGQDLDDAANALRQLGLNPQRPDSADDNDRVTGTDPAAGTRVERGSDVELLTGNGDEAELPDVVGLTRDQAVDRLGDAGFRQVRIEEERVSNDSQDGRVLQQSPSAGRRIPTDQQITLTVGDTPGLVN
jgi:eukaryotic-like serine/threonine-protein kinase